MNIPFFRFIRRFHFLASVSVFCAVFSGNASGVTPDAIGGGYSSCGILGEYFATPDLSGSPVFSRRDVRIDFDWGTQPHVGGSNYRPYRAFPRDSFSIRWTGKIIPRYSEPYTFVADANDGVRVFLKRAGASSWTTIIDSWSQAGVHSSDTVNLSASAGCDVRVEYCDLKGAPKCRLLWQSPSTPQEIIDPLVAQGLNIASFPGSLWANKLKDSRWDDNVRVLDSLEYPLDSAILVMSEGDPADPLLAGTYLLSFKGQAQVRTGCCNTVRFTVAGTTYTNKLERGIGYDAATNTTTAEMSVDGSRLVNLGFYQTSRTPSALRGSGITGITLMRPLVPNGTSHHDSSEIVFRQFKTALRDHYTCLRLLTGANGNTDSIWADRTVPDDAFFSRAKPKVYWSEQENWEYLIMLANETGKDLYLTLPIKATDDYFRNLANLLRYGSDGVSPYTSSQADPAYPPLNPNLRVYLEVGNEIWNWPFASTGKCREMCIAEQAANSDVWKAMNYDGKLSGDGGGIYGMRRWLAIRTVGCSNAFRTVFGDNGMGTRVRVITEYQYDDGQETASRTFQMFSEYFNNGTGNHVPAPHPPSYYLWGAGGATYYGVGNPIGHQNRILVADSSFEQAALTAHSLQTRPAGSAWTFAGESGIYYSTKQNDTIGALSEADTAPDGRQAAFIIDTGSISQSIIFPAAGYYAVYFKGAYNDPGWSRPLGILIDTTSINPYGQSDDRTLPLKEGAALGGWARNTGDLSSEWGSAVFTIAAAGPHTIVFKGIQTGGRHIYLDNIRIASVDSIMESGFGSGQAAGQVTDANYAKQLFSQAKYARTFGLQVIAYEAGWSLGGDFTQRPIQVWCKFHEPRATRINDTAESIWEKSGSFMNVWGVYQYWPEYGLGNVDTFPLMKSLENIASRVPADCQNGKVVPCVLRGIYKTDDVSWAYRGDRNRLRGRGCWASWLFVTPERATYGVSVFATGRGGYRVFVDDGLIGAADPLPAGGPVAFSVGLVKGGHAIRIESTRDTATIDSVSIVKTGKVSILRTAKPRPVSDRVLTGAAAAARMRGQGRGNSATITGAARGQASWGSASMHKSATPSDSAFIDQPIERPVGILMSGTGIPQGPVSAFDLLSPAARVVISGNAPPFRLARGYLVPESTFSGRIYLSANGPALLALSFSEDTSEAMPIARVICGTADQDWLAEAGQRSVPIALVGGRRYYLEISYSPIDGSGFWALGWANEIEYPELITRESVVPFEKH